MCEYRERKYVRSMTFVWGRVDIMVNSCRTSGINILRAEKNIEKLKNKEIIHFKIVLIQKQDNKKKEGEEKRCSEIDDDDLFFTRSSKHQAPSSNQHFIMFIQCSENVEGFEMILLK